MSLENSNYTYFTLEGAGSDAFKAEVDRFVKEVDNRSINCQTSSDESPRKRARYHSQEGGYGSQPQPVTQHMSGVILEVTLENFLCHERFKIALNHRLNFIVGRNGSGKSAILTGIIVALGGSANMTGRGSSLKDFVKHNCQSARVTVVVNNAGSLNFCRELYGNKIIVVRTIDNLGRSKVELKTEQGKTFSNKMQDLRGMCLKLGIQVDNPISVLDQNTAKTFLLQNKPAQLYHLFMKATDLEALRLLHDEIERLFIQTNQEIRKKTRDLENNNAELVEVERKYKLLQSFEEDKVKEDILKVELLRAQARDSSIEVTNSQKALMDAQTERLELEKLLSSDHEAQTLLQAHEDTKKEAIDLAKQLEEAQNNFKIMKIKYSDNLKEQKSCGLDRKQLEVRMQHNQVMITEFKAEINLLEKRLQPTLVEDKKKREEEISVLHQTLKQYEDFQVESKAKLQYLQESLGNCNDALVELRDQEKKLQNSLLKKEKDLQALVEDQSDLCRFGPSMRRLVDLLEENAKKFKRKPVGPLGNYVRVKDPKWVKAVESAIAPRINNFLVENREDEKLIQSLMRTVHGPKPGIVRCHFLPPIDTSMRAARTPNYSNVLDMIEVTDPDVRNSLIELFKVESTLLIPTDDECYALLKDKRTVPKNCLKAITLKGSSYFPDPNYRTYGATHDEARFLGVSPETLITGMSTSIKNIKDQLKEVCQKSTSASLEVERKSELIKEAKIANSKNIENLIEAKNKLDQLKDSEKPDTHSIATLKEDLEERERRHLENKSLLTKFDEKLDTLQREKRELKSKGTEYLERKNILEKQRQSIIVEQTKLGEKIEKLKCFQTNSKNRINQIKKLEDQHVSTLKKLEDTLKQRNQDAEKFEIHLVSEGVNLEEIPNTESSRNTVTIDSELKLLIKRRASMEKLLGNSSNEIILSYHDTFALHAGVLNKIKTLEKNSAYLKEALEKRQTLYLTQRKYIGCVVSHQFTRVLLQRNCIGNIKVNFEKKLLNINVGPIDEGDRAGLGTSSLSGGERSYTTMAFVIALWIVTELPFYYLDEFDVFMDVLNRQTILNLLLKFARLKGGYQFGFLTPLDTTALRESEDLSIYKLDNPRDT